MRLLAFNNSSSYISSIGMETIDVATKEAGFFLYCFTQAVVFVILLARLNNADNLIFLELVGILDILFGRDRKSVV